MLTNKWLTRKTQRNKLAALLHKARKENWSRRIRTPADRKAVLEGCHFNIEAAERVRTFFKKFIRHSTGKWAGKPFELLDCQWQQIVAPLFGWFKLDGNRRFDQAFVTVAKKNARIRNHSLPACGRWRVGSTKEEVVIRLACLLASRRCGSRTKFRGRAPLPRMGSRWIPENDRWCGDRRRRNQT